MRKHRLDIRRYDFLDPIMEENCGKKSVWFDSVCVFSY